MQVRQELEQKYGHYEIVRRTTIGILQADDLGVVKKETISTATEELMLSTPNYWLAPCLVALAAWINDQPELAEKALREGIRRDDEKTSLFFALICRRADRMSACLKWTQRYLVNQDETKLDRKTIIVLDAFASGLLGADLESTVRDLAYRDIANKNFVLNEENMLNAFNNVVPLSQTSPEKIESIREWEENVQSRHQENQ